MPIMTPEEFARDMMLEDLQNTMRSFGEVKEQKHHMGTIFFITENKVPRLKILYDPDANVPVRFFRDHLLTEETLAMKMYFGPEYKMHFEAYRELGDLID